MEELRIKCPSCGIVLAVRNSKNEAVKRITCPNCKKHLAVTFREEPKPAQYVEIKMVQLADGSQKTIVRALTDNHIVKVNGEQLLKDDEVVLGPDDQLEIDGKPQFGSKTKQESIPAVKPNPASKPEHSPNPQPEPKDEPKGLTPTSEPKRNNWLLPIAIVAVIVAVFVLWQKFSDSKSEAVPSIPSTDTIVVPRQETGKKDMDEPKPNKEAKKDELKAEEQQPVVKPANANISEYDLERMAIKGDIEAQCLLGKRWVNKGDSTNVVKGIKYLKQAAHNGSSEAKTALNKVYATLQRSAANGSTTASNILREQR